MSDLIQDIQCKKILQGISSLLKLLKEGLVEKILEINNNVESKDHFNLLKRIERSVDQYVKRDGRLFYIGFLGHYSSGKSSTINSILKLKGSKNERPVNINPTDDQITLLTNSDNNDQVVKLIRTGNVPVVLCPIDNNDYLNDKIIMDTPGSGDPSLVEEIVRDSLPLCDLIVYCISAANPLDNSDVPLLLEKQKNLNQIPTIYVITRGSEFKNDDFMPLTEGNFNLNEARISLSELASRMNEVIDSINVSYDDFIIIDNKDQFNIDKLVESISAHTNSSTQLTIVNLHGHKIDFFIRASTKIKEHFTELIVDKLLTMENFVSKAQKNIDEYDQKTLIGSDKLIVEWRNSDERIKQVIEGSINENNRLYQTLDTATNFSNLASVERWLDNVKRTAKYANQQIAEEGRSLLNNRLYDLKEKFKDHLYTHTALSSSISKKDVSSFLYSLVMNVPVPINSPFNYKTEFNEFYAGTLTHITSEKYELLKKAFDSLLQRTRGKNPLDSIHKHIEDAKSIMSGVFESYNEAVKIYRVAAFSSEAKNYIRKLGLSLELDKLDTETVKSQDYYSKAQQEIFEKYNKEILAFKEGCTKAEHMITESKVDYPVITSHDKEMEIQSLTSKHSDDVRLVIEVKSKEIFEKAKKRLVDLTEILNQERTQFATQKNKELIELKRQRIRYYTIRYIPSFLVIIFTCLLFNFPESFSFLNINPSLGWQWVLGLLSNVAFAALTTLFIRAKDSFPRKQNEVTNKYALDEKQVISKVVDAEYNQFHSDLEIEFRNHIQLSLNERTEQDISNLVSTKFSENLHKYHQTIFSSEKKIKQAIEVYSSLLNNLKSTINIILNNSKFNKEVITNHAKHIKVNSINPSFELLFKTKNDILKIQKLFSTIEFHS